MLTQQRIKEYLTYLPDTGEFFANHKSINRPAGRKLGTVHSTGYCVIRVDDKLYKAHRLAWLYMTGVFPEKIIDHINRIKSDNRWTNLKEFSQSQNSENNPLKKSNTSGFVGVSWNRKLKKWRARITFGYKEKHLGYFESKELAFAAYAQAAAKFHTNNSYSTSRENPDIQMNSSMQH